MEVVKSWSTITRAFCVGLTLGIVSVYFVLQVTADVGTIEPNADGTIASSQTTCGGGGAYDCLDDGITTAGTPSTAGDYLSLSNTKNDYYLMETVGNVDVVTSVTIHIYHVEGGASAFGTLGLFAANETTQYGTTQNVPNRSIAQWDSVTISGLSLTGTQLDDLRIRFDCEKSGGGPSYACNAYALYADVTYTPLTNVLVGTAGTQQNVDVGTTDAYIGGAFTMVENTNCTSCAIDSITIAESGSVDAAVNLSNVRLYYDLDTTTPYDCASESYAGTEPQYGATTTFNGANGSATFTGNVSVSTTQAMCVYPVMDVSASSSAGQTILLDITDPSVDVSTVLNQVVRPTTTVSLSGATVLQKVELTQTHYHWRNDNGDQGDTGTGATSATGGTHDTALTTLGVESPIRLRLQVSNEGNKTSAGEQYRLEYAQKVSTCAAATGWTDVGDVGGDFDMYDTANLTNGNDTTDIANSSGGVPNENTTFLTPNGGVRDTTSQTGIITLTSSQFVELEYGIEATTNATEGTNYCFRLTDAGSELDFYTAYAEATILADLNVTAKDSQPTFIDISTTNVYMGGFSIVDQTVGDHTISSITISATGTADLQNDIDNIRLYYDLDTSAPYNCASESYSGTEAMFGAVDTDGFSASYTSTFSTSTPLSITQTQAVCTYVVFDVLDTSDDGVTVEVEMTDPSTEVIINAGTVSPSSLVSVTNTTQLVKPILTLTHYHWRDDLGAETASLSATGGIDDTKLDQWKIGVPKRLRFQVANLGSSSTGPYSYRLEYATKLTSCAVATGWTDVGATADEFDMYNSANLTNGNDTTNISEAFGGMPDEATTFLINNNAVLDTASQSGSITLLGNYFTELEYSIVASTTVTEGQTYCFRLSDAGTALEFYDVYAEATIKPPTDFFIQRDAATITGTSITLTAGVDYIAPASTSTAFVRITNTQLTGAGDSASPANQNSDDVTAYISVSDITSSFDIVRFGAGGDTRVGWEIVEFTGAPGSNNEIIVRQQSNITYTATANTVTTGVIGAVDKDEDVVVFITGQGNPNTGRTAYNTGLSTATWNAGASTTTFTRGDNGSNAVVVSYAVVEFVGDNWKVQRVEHTYDAVGSASTTPITAVNSTARAFVHAQKRVGSGLNTHANIGHEVWLSGIGQVSFYLDNQATTPSGHASVAWVIENVQTNGTPMVVTRSNGTQSGGAEPGTYNISIGKTLSDIEVASLFISNRSSGAVTTFPQPMIAARILNTTQYELWVSKTTDIRNYRTEVVEWPTGDRELAQNYYRFYVNNDALDPVDPWPTGATDLGENTEVTETDGPIALGEAARLRMTLQISAAKMNPGADAFKLEYGERITTCSAVSQWYAVGAVGSTTALWRGTTTSQTDGTQLSTDPPTVGDLNISVSDVAGTFEEESPSSFTPYQVDPGEDVEFDWIIEHNGAKEKTSYCFRMTESDGTLLSEYNFHPVMRTAGYTPQLNVWRFYDDETSITPTSPLAIENSAPIDIANENIIKLRTTIEETTGGVGTDAKFKLQYSEYADFSQDVYDVVSTSTCTASSTWCYADGAGVDNGLIDSAVLSDADACAGGVGAGCGTHNESSASTTATYDQQAYSVAEYEFTLQHAGARVNTVYYFRLYDMQNATTVPATTNYPSLVTEGGSLQSTVTAVPIGTNTEGVVTDVETTPTRIAFDSLPIDTELEAAYRVTMNTNATDGYQLYMFTSSDLIDSYGNIIEPVTGTNALPLAWADGCAALADSCVGYHVGDDTLANGSTRFAPNDTYAALSQSPAEVMYSGVPAVNETTDIIFKIKVSNQQPAGIYASQLVFISVPIF